LEIIHRVYRNGHSGTHGAETRDGVDHLELETGVAGTIFVGKSSVGNTVGNENRNRGGKWILNEHPICLS